MRSALSHLTLPLSPLGLEPSTFPPLTRTPAHAGPEAEDEQGDEQEGDGQEEEEDEGEQEDEEDDEEEDGDEGEPGPSKRQKRRRRKRGPGWGWAVPDALDPFGAEPALNQPTNDALKEYRELTRGNVTVFSPSEAKHPINFFEQSVRCKHCGCDRLRPTRATLCCQGGSLLLGGEPMPEALIDLLGEGDGVSQSSRSLNNLFRFAQQGLPKGTHRLNLAGGHLKVLILTLTLTTPNPDPDPNPDPNPDPDPDPHPNPNPNPSPNLNPKPSR